MFLQSLSRLGLLGGLLLVITNIMPLISVVSLVGMVLSVLVIRPLNLVGGMLTICLARCIAAR